MAKEGTAPLPGPTLRVHACRLPLSCFAKSEVAQNGHTSGLFLMAGKLFLVMTR